MDFISQNIKEEKLHRFQVFLLAYDDCQRVILYLVDTLVILFSLKVEDILYVLSIHTICLMKTTNKTKHKNKTKIIIIPVAAKLYHKI